MGAPSESISVVYEESTKVAFPSFSEDGKELCAVGVRKKSIMGLIAIKIYAFGIYADWKALEEILKPMFDPVPDKASREMYSAIVDGDMGLEVRLEIVFGGLNMHMVKKIFNDNLRASIKNFSEDEHGELLERVLGEAKEDIKLPAGSVIQIKKLPGYVLQTQVKGEVVSEVESKLLCQAFFNMYLGDEPLDAQAKASFGKSLISNVLKN
ncbi:chalcone isomerase-like protein 1 [Tasmannia lanceolata]|uniref:chalcone isomerase-like protein 1 n=1 Tax=Tasmannia lanceolata TaxID=3420 RepID=UPI004064AC00